LLWNAGEFRVQNSEFRVEGIGNRQKAIEKRERSGECLSREEETPLTTMAKPEVFRPCFWKGRRKERPVPKKKMRNLRMVCRSKHNCKSAI